MSEMLGNNSKGIGNFNHSTKATEDKTKELENTINGFTADQEGFVYFGDVARRILNQQSQYASRYVDGAIDGYPNLGEGLRFIGKPSNYHSLKIHKDDIIEFINRVKNYNQHII